MLASTALLACSAVASFGGALSPTVRETPRVTIAPGVEMPVVNLGGVLNMSGVAPGNWSLFLEIGGRGLDTALSYGEARCCFWSCWWCGLWCC
jgi:hypothetical protein